MSIIIIIAFISVGLFFTNMSVNLGRINRERMRKIHETAMRELASAIESGEWNGVSARIETILSTAEQESSKV